MTLADEAVGTPNYRPPECSGHSEHSVTSHADFYSAGKILWSMITNNEAFEREAPVFNRLALHEILPEVRMAWHFHILFAGTIREDPAQRYGNALHLLGDARFVKRLIEERRIPAEAIAKGECPHCGMPPQSFGTQWLATSNALEAYMTSVGLAGKPVRACRYCFCVTPVASVALHQSLEERKKLR